MLLTSIITGAALIAAQVFADTEAERAAQRNAPVQELLSRKPVQGVQKMSCDEGEKFFMDYWHFEDDAVSANTSEVHESNERTATDRDILLPRSYPYQPPFMLDLGRFSDPRLSPLLRRDFECPAGTHGCTSINRPDSCCRTDETCVVVEDTGSGTVGCCPAGQGCSGTIGSCWEGYTSCPSSLGGGCCIPGYDCVEGGCEYTYLYFL
ncbi:hypothetical protein BJX61DRAFT_1856 [Aspergillus egyptiacus]|nr:hypothetical protein BJX61DRAFT_1856 [Aspergillus egyptiacus]